MVEINFPVKGVEQSIFCRDFKILGVVGELEQKDKMGYQALVSQIEVGLAERYSGKEVVSAVSPCCTTRFTTETLFKEHD